MNGIQYLGEGYGIETKQEFCDLIPWKMFGKTTGV